MSTALRVHHGLADASRFARSVHTENAASIAEWAALVGIGMTTAAVSTLVDLHMRVPGHAILKVVFPIAAGLAFVPRRGAASLMSLSALATAIPLRLAGFTGEGLGFGALTSLIMIGPLLDWTLRRAQSRRAIYAGFVIAGLATNLLAFGVRGTLKGLGWEHAGGRPLAAWLTQASMTYTLCGVAAGLLSASVWFCMRPRRMPPEREPVA